MYGGETGVSPWPGHPLKATVGEGKIDSGSWCLEGHQIGDKMSRSKDPHQHYSKTKWKSGSGICKEAGGNHRLWLSFQMLLLTISCLYPQSKNLMSNHSFVPNSSASVIILSIFLMLPGLWLSPSTAWEKTHLLTACPVQHSPHKVCRSSRNLHSCSD